MIEQGLQKTKKRVEVENSREGGTYSNIGSDFDLWIRVSSKITSSFFFNTFIHTLKTLLSSSLYNTSIHTLKTLTSSFLYNTTLLLRNAYDTYSNITHFFRTYVNSGKTYRLRLT